MLLYKSCYKGAWGPVALGDGRWVMRTDSIRPTMTARSWWIAGVVLLATGMSRGALGNPDLGKSWSRKIANAKERFVVLSAFSQKAALDMETGLVWERSPSTKLSTWLEAMGDCYSRIVGDRLGWRLPTIEELASMIDRTQSSPPFLPRGHPFTNVQSGGQLYWSATSLFSTPPKAFAMKPSDGTVGVNIKALREGLVWCVRGSYGYSPDVLSE
jgi:hypothetical protein